MEGNQLLKCFTPGLLAILRAQDLDNRFWFQCSKVDLCYGHARRKWLCLWRATWRKALHWAMRKTF